MRFQRDELPRIAVYVGTLETGFDCPDVRNLLPSLMKTDSGMMSSLPQIKFGESSRFPVNIGPYGMKELDGQPISAFLIKRDYCLADIRCRS